MAIGRNSTGKTQHTIEVRVDGEERAEAALSGVSKKSDALSASIQKQSSAYIPAKKAAVDYQKALRATAVALGAVSIAAYKVFSSYAEQEKVERKLRAVAGPLTQELMEQATAFQRVSIHGDEAIMSTQRLLLNLGGERIRGRMKEATQATLDLAAAFGWDLTQAARNVGRTFGGFAGELGEVVPELRELTREQLMNGEAVDVLIKKYGGQSKAETDTLYGAMSQMANAASDLTQALGKKTGLAGVLVDVAHGFRDMATEISRVNTGGMLGVLADALELQGVVAGGPLAAKYIRRLANEAARKDAEMRTEQMRIKGLERQAVGERSGLDVSSLLGGEEKKTAGKPGGKSAAKADVTSKDIAQAGIDAVIAIDEQRRKSKEYETELHYIRLREIDAEREARFAAQSEEADGLMMLRETQQRNSEALRDSIIDAVGQSTRAYGQFFELLVGGNRKAMHKIQKVMLFVEGGMAVTRGVIALQTALATLVQTEGASAADIPGAVSLIASGTMMMAGQLLSAGRARGSGGHGGYGRSPRAMPGRDGMGGGAVNNYYYFQSLEPVDPAALGKRIKGYTKAADEEAA